MATEVNDYLTKQVLIDRNVVTFRSLSRQFQIHVNVAKTHLAAFHHASKGTSEPAFATYLLTGEIESARKKRLHTMQDSMDVDNVDTPSNFDEEDDGEDVPITKVLLVGENLLEEAKSQYVRIFSEHVYSLSPSLLVDAGLVCAPSEKVHEADAKASAESSVLLGRIIGPHVHIGRPVPLVASTSKSQSVSVQKKPLFTKKPLETEQPKEEKAVETKLSLRPKQTTKEEKPALKPRPSGTLDWSKAKSKKEDQEVSAKETNKSDGNKQTSSERKKKSSSGSQTKDTPRPGTPMDSEPSRSEVKRGIKRKSVLAQGFESGDDHEKSAELIEKKSPVTKERTAPRLLEREDKPGAKRKSAISLISKSDDEESSGSTSTPATARVKLKKGAVVSDDDDDDEFEPGNRSMNSRGKAKGKTRISNPPEVDKSLRAMMDIDDDEVIMASRPSPDTEGETEKSAIGDAETVEDSEPERIKAKPKRKEKKVIPVGRNGLKKKKIRKSRVRTDEKGYTITEDYSSYESVDEEDAEAGSPPKGKGGKGRSMKSKKSSDTAETKVNGHGGGKSEHTSNKTLGDSLDPKRRKPAGTTKRGQGSLMNFFGKSS